MIKAIQLNVLPKRKQFKFVHQISKKKKYGLKLYTFPKKNNTDNAIQCNTIQLAQCNTLQHNTTQYNTIQHNTKQHNTILHCTIQYNTTQYNTMHLCFFLVSFLVL